MAPPGAQPNLADDATFEPRGHSRYNSTATQATLAADVAQPGAGAARRSSKYAASDADSDDIQGVVDNQRFRVTAGTPAGPTVATTAAKTGSATAAAPQSEPIITAAALAVADPTTAAVAGPDEGPPGAHIEGAATGVGNGDGYEDSSEDDFDYDNAFYIDVPPGHKMIRVSTPGPDDVLDEDGNAWRGPVPIDDVPPVCATEDIDEDEDWVLSGGADDDNASGNDANGNDANGDDGDNNEDDGGNDSDLDPAVLPKGPDAAGTIGWKDVRTEYNRERVAKETVAVSRVAPTVPLPPNFVPVPLAPEPDNILRPPCWDEELEKHIAAPLAPPDDAPPVPPVPRTAKRRRVEKEDDEDEPALRAHKKARRGKPLDIDEVCARLTVIAWIIGVYGTCARLTDGRRDWFASANADDAEGDAGVEVDGQNNSEHGGDEYDEDADWVLQV